jgi:hypothetical protein
MREQIEIAQLTVVDENSIIRSESKMAVPQKLRYGLFIQKMTLMNNLSNIMLNY